MSEFRRALVILNPGSGQHDAEATAHTISARLQTAGMQVEVRLTTGPGDGLAWAEAAPGEGFDLVVAAGGDGTIMEVMSGLIHSKADVPLAQIPVGTANLLARALTIPADLDGSLDAICTGRLARFDVGYLPTHDRYFALVAGCGYDARLIADASRELKNVLGFGAYVVTGSGISFIYGRRMSSCKRTASGGFSALTR